MENIPQWFIDLMDEVTNWADGEYGDTTLQNCYYIRGTRLDSNGHYEYYNTDLINERSYQYVWEQIQKNLKENN